jgi:hypothetical protein
VLTRARYIGRYGQIQPGTAGVVTVPNPAAGADFTVNVPGSEQWRIVSLFAILTTSAGVANRWVRFQITDGANQYFETVLSNVIVANTAARISAAIGAQQITSSAPLQPWTTYLLDEWIPPSGVFRSSIGNVDVADQWSSVALYVEKLRVTNQDLADIASGGEVRGEGWPTPHTATAGG